MSELVTDRSGRMRWVMRLILTLAAIALGVALILAHLTVPQIVWVAGAGLVVVGVATLALVDGGGGHSRRWTRVVSGLASISAGVVVLAIFVVQQARTKTEALVPLALFRDRNFSGANAAIAAVGFAVTAMSLPFMFYLQLARGLTPTNAALLLVPYLAWLCYAAYLNWGIDQLNPNASTLVPGAPSATYSF